MLQVRGFDVRILLIEDDEMLGEDMRSGIMQEGHVVDWAVSGEAAWEALMSVDYDLLLVDLGLPDSDGSDLIRDLRQKGSDVRIIVVSARDEVGTRIASLRLGADDYLVKPFDLNELCARIEASGRRLSTRSNTELTCEGLVVDTASHGVTLDGEPVTLSGKEYALLLRLLEDRGRVFSREQLERAIYGDDAIVESNTVEVHIHNLRKKLGGRLIRTIRGHGYVLG